MRAKIAFATIVALFVCFGGVVPAAQAQGSCTLQTLTGTYAVSEKGSSTIIPDPTSEPYPYHWSAALAPYVGVGAVTFGPDGTGRGAFWVRIGSFTGGADPVPVEVRITELNADCSGKWQFDFSLLGSTIEERFIAFDSGREIRSIPTATGVPAMTWIGEAHRISKPGEPLQSLGCGPQTAKGAWLMVVDNLVRMGANPTFSDVLLLRLDISMSGDYTGMLYEKLGLTGNIEIPASGTMSVYPDCLFATDLNLTIQGKPTTAPVRGVFFDEGKKSFLLNVNARSVGTQYSFGKGERIGQ